MKKHLKELESAHNAMHDIANNFFKKFQQGDAEKTKDYLNNLTVTVDILNNILE